MENKKNNRRKNTIVLLTVFVIFASSLYLVEWSSIGATAVGQYNNGYGTFDMKSYSAETVSEVLQNMQPEGFHVYRQYFVADYFFVLTFGLLQILLLNSVYRWTKQPIRKTLWIVPILRGICDVVENTLLLITLNSYPDIHAQLLEIASGATWLKLMLIRIWSVLFLAGLLVSIVRRIGKRSALNRGNA